MNELTGICKPRSLGNRKDDRAAGIFVKPDLLFSVTPDRKVKVHTEGGILLTENEFNDRYYVVELPSLTINQRRMREYKAILSQERMVGEPAQDLKFKIKLRNKEEVISFRHITRTSAVKTISREFKKHLEVYEWFEGDWLLIKRGSS